MDSAFFLKGGMQNPKPRLQDVFYLGTAEGAENDTERKPRMIFINFEVL